jgi:hypothetical protein
VRGERHEGGCIAVSGQRSNGIWIVVHGTALVRYRRLASFHSRLAQVGIALFSAFALVLFFSRLRRLALLPGGHRLFLRRRRESGHDLFAS